MAREYEAIRQSSHCIRANDGKHVTLFNSVNSESTYFN